MTKEQRLERNIAAAELLGHEYIIHDKLASGAVSIKLHSNKTRLFNLFENPADCMAVVKKLGTEYGADIVSEDGLWNREGTASTAQKAMSMDVEPFETYEEAVGAACLEIEGE